VEEFDNDKSGARESRPRLQPWARFGALSTGAILGGIGCWAVLNESGNQAGTVGILGTSLVLLIMGLQNSPLTGITPGGGANFELKKQAGMTALLAREKLNEGDPEEAQVVIDTAEALDARILSDEIVKSVEYDTQVILAYKRVGFILEPASSVDYWEIENSPGILLSTTMRQLDGSVNRRFLLRLVSQIRGSSNELGSRFGGLILVTDVPISRETIELLPEFEDGFRFDIVIWRNPTDDEDLRSAVRRLSLGMTGLGQELESR
jgi:hypothetical protein